MRRILILLCILTIASSANAQTWNKVNGRWQYQFLKTDSVFTPPQDTLFSAANGSVAVKNDVVYFKNNNGVWMALAPIRDEWISVVDYGAKPNDTLTDYTANIQAALNTGARTVLLPTGLYKLTNSLKIKSNQTIIGYGAKLIRKANTDAMIINESNGTIGGYMADSNMAVVGITFEGNAINYPTSAYGGATLVVFGHSSNITIRDCNLTNAPVFHLIEINACNNTVIENCVLHDANIPTKELLQIDLAVDSSAFPWFGPFDRTPVQGIKILNCTFKNSNKGIGSHSLVDTFPHRDIVIQNCIFDNMVEMAIEPYNWNNTVIEGNSINNCRHGIIDFSAFDNQFKINSNYRITNNSIKKILRGVSTGMGIELRYAQNVVITGNTVDSVAGNGIALLWSDSCIIDKNKVSNFGITATLAYGIAAWGTSNTRILNNHINTSTRTDAIVLKNDVTLPKNVFIEGNIIRRPNLLGNYYQFSQYEPLECSNCYIGKNIVNDTLVPNTTSLTGGSYSVSGTEGTLSVNTTSGSQTITLNPAIINDGITIYKSAGANSITVNTSTGNINGGSSITVDSVITLKSDGINYLSNGNEPANRYIKNQTALVQPSSGYLVQQGAVISGGFTGYQNLGTIHPLTVTQGGGSYAIILERATNDGNAAHLAFYKTRWSDFSKISPARLGDVTGDIIWRVPCADSTTIGTSNFIDNFVRKAGSNYVSADLRFWCTDTSGSSNNTMSITNQGTVRMGGASAVTSGTKLEVQSGNVYFNGNLGIGNATPTARLYLPAGTATVNTAPLKFISGTNLTTPEDGAMEYDGVHYYVTIGSTRYQLDQQSGGVIKYQHSISTPSTGGTVNLINGQYNIINPSGTIATLTVNLPSSPVNNDVVYIKYTQAVTTVTYSNGTVVDGIISPTSGTLVVLTYDAGTSSWY